MASHRSIWQPYLQRRGVVILDGGLATELERRGADLRDPLWSAKLLIENPVLIRQVHEDYFRAGADVGTTASYQASFEGFAKRGINEMHAAELMRASVRLVRDARDRVFGESDVRPTRPRPLVAASLGCYGATLHDGSEYRGNYGLPVQQLIEWHRPKMAVLAAAGADVLACETIPCLAEAEALVRLLQAFPNTAAWFSFSCRDELHICEGATLLEAIQTAEATPNVVAAGINCTPPQFVEGLLDSVRSRTKLPLLAYPNSGECWNAATHSWENGATPVNWGEAALRWRAAGATLIGGCCRTTPAVIAEMASAVQARRSSR